MTSRGKGRGMKGQLVFEFVIATIFFLTIIMYTISYLNNTVFLYSNDYYTNSLESKAWQMSEILVNKPGDWSGSAPNMVPSELGLEEQWPVLDEGKIESLESWCGSNMDVMMGMLDIDTTTHGMRLEINKSGGTLLDCGRLPAGIENARVTRFGISDVDDGLLEIRIWYW